MSKNVTPAVGPEQPASKRGEIVEPLTASQRKSYTTALPKPSRQIRPEVEVRPRSTDGRVWSPGAYTEHPAEIESNYVE